MTTASERRAARTSRVERPRLAGTAALVGMVALGLAIVAMLIPGAGGG